jgi:glycine/D-amino acid oxidase-like deaminating enzyme
MGDPENEREGRVHHASALVPGRVLDTLEDEILPFATSSRREGLPFDFQRHGLMGCSPGKFRVVGTHPNHPSLHYNPGCDGVGFLPSVYGARRLARNLHGEHPEASIFDPREG